MITHNISRRGSMIFVATLVIVLSMMLLSNAVETFTSRTKLSNLEQARVQARYAAEAIAAIQEVELVELAATNDLDGLANTPAAGVAWEGTSYFAGCMVRWRIEPAAVATNDQFAINPAADPSEAPPSNQDVDGDGTSDSYLINRDIYNFRIATEAYALTDPNDATAQPWSDPTDRLAIAQASRVVQLKLNSLFKYALFYAATGTDGDIEFHNGPELSIDGAVHSNGAIYFGGDKESPPSDYHPGDNGPVTIGSSGDPKSVVAINGLYRTQKVALYDAYIDGIVSSLDPINLPNPGDADSGTGYDMTGNYDLNGNNSGTGYTINNTAMLPGYNDSRNPSQMGLDWGTYVRDGVTRGATVVRTLANIPELGGRPFEDLQRIADSDDAPTYLWVRAPLVDDFTLTVLPEDPPSAYYYDPFSDRDADDDNDFEFTDDVPDAAYLALSSRSATDFVIQGTYAGAGVARRLYYAKDPSTITSADKSSLASTAYSEAGAGTIPGLPTYIQTQPTNWPVTAAGMERYHQQDSSSAALFGQIEVLTDVTDPAANFYDSARSWYSPSTRYNRTIGAIGEVADSDPIIDRGASGNESDGLARNAVLGHYHDRALFGGDPVHEGVGIVIRERPEQATHYWSGGIPNAADAKYGGLSGITPPSSGGGAVVHYEFEDGSGGTASDSSGNSRDGTMTGASWSTGYSGGGLEFSSNSSHQVLDDDGETYLNGLSAITVAMWIESDSASTDKGFLHCVDPAGNDEGLAMRYDNSGASGGGSQVLKCAIETSSGNFQIETSNNTQTTNWQHVVMTWESGGPIEIYLDGALDAPTFQTSTTVNGTITNLDKLIVGRGGKDGSSSWDGKIDDFRIYDFKVDATDVADIMAGNHPAAASSQQAHGGAAQTITGSGVTTVQAEHYDEGGNGVAFNDGNATDNGTIGGARLDGVDWDLISGNGGFAFSDVEAGDWLEFTVDIEETGEYSVGFIAATDQSGVNLHLEAGGTDVTGAVAITNTGDMTKYTSNVATSVLLAAGEQIIRIVFDSAQVNLDAITFEKTASSATFTQDLAAYMKSQYQVYFGTYLTSGTQIAHLDVTAAFFDHGIATATSTGDMVAFESWVRNRRETGYMGWKFDIDGATHSIALNDYHCNWITINVDNLCNFVDNTLTETVDPTVTAGSTETLKDRFSGIVFVSRTRRSNTTATPSSSYHGIVDQYPTDSSSNPLLPHGYHPIWNPEWDPDYDEDWDENDYTPPTHQYALTSNAALAAQYRVGNGPDATFHNAVRVAQGASLDWGGWYTESSIKRKRGLTITTGNPLFIQGDYNTTMYDSSSGTMSYPGLVGSDSLVSEAEFEVARAAGFELPPAAVFTDSLAVLSNNWDDAAEADFSSTLQTASATWYNTSVVTNNVPTIILSGSTVVPSGGPHNLVRYLESWSGNWYHVKGSTVVMGVCKFSRAEAGWSGNSRTSGQRYYRPPKRDIQFNTDLFERPGQPPFTPFGVQVVRTVQTIHERIK